MSAATGEVDCTSGAPVRLLNGRWKDLWDTVQAEEGSWLHKLRAAEYTEKQAASAEQRLVQEQRECTELRVAVAAERGLILELRGQCAKVGGLRPQIAKRDLWRPVFRIQCIQCIYRGSD